MSIWFGKNCKYLAAQWEDNEITGGPDYKEVPPALVFCNHSKNECTTEGNCNSTNCPLGFTIETFEKPFELKDPLPGTQFSLWKDNIYKALVRSLGQCVCVSDPIQQGKHTLCPCEEYRNTLICRCNLYIQEGVPKL